MPSNQVNQEQVYSEQEWGNRLWQNAQEVVRSRSNSTQFGYSGVSLYQYLCMLWSLCVNHLLFHDTSTHLQLLGLALLPYDVQCPHTPHTQFASNFSPWKQFGSFSASKYAHWISCMLMTGQKNGHKSVERTLSWAPPAVVLVTGLCCETLRANFNFPAASSPALPSCLAIKVSALLWARNHLTVNISDVIKHVYKFVIQTWFSKI